MKIKEIPKIAKRIHRPYSLCGKDIKVIVYKNGAYRGGHFFGRITNLPSPLTGEGLRVRVKYPEYWECPRCYWP